MTAFLVSILLYLPVSLGFAALVAERADRRFLTRSVLFAWFTLVPLTAIIDGWMPFSLGGDDENYFYLGNTPIESLADVFDLTRYFGMMAQPGYPWLLSLLNFFTGPDLLAYKLLNLLFLILTALTWYRIAVLLEGRKFGRVVLIGTLLLTPLWYYAFFLLKDLVITLLQSLFLLGLVQQWASRGLRTWLVIGISTFFLLLFRVHLVLQNVAVLFSTLTFMVFARGRRGLRLLPLIIGSIVAWGVLNVARNSETMMVLGIHTEGRIVGSEAMLESVSTLGESSLINRGLFPLLYLLSETAGLSPEAWAQFDSSWLRGVLAVPWIIFVVPFFIMGVLWLRLPPDGRPSPRGALARLQSSRLISTPWSALLLFVLSSLAISWFVSNTTRWRIPDMPVMMTIAMAGWVYSTRHLRKQLLFLWIVGGGLLFIMFYLFK